MPTHPPHCCDPEFGDVPEHPLVVTMTYGRWMPLAAQLQANQPIRAELSYFTNSMWHGGDTVTLSHIDRFLLVGFTDEPACVMPVAMPGATVTPENEAALAALFRDHRVGFMSATTRDALQPIIDEIGCELVDDLANADYVYEASRLSTFDGPDLKRHRQDLHHFERRMDAGQCIRIREGRLNEPAVFDHVVESFDGWSAGKYARAGGPPPEIAQERHGLLSWPRDERIERLRVFCLEVDRRPAGVSIVEPMPWGHTWMGLVYKFDRSLKGANQYLRRHVARAALRDLGSRGLLNIAQDDGDPGRRHAKASLRPLRLDRKFLALPSADRTP